MEDELYCLECDNIRFNDENWYYCEICINKRTNATQKSYLAQFKEFKATLKCAVCDEDETCCLDFHHLDPSTKEYQIATKTRKTPLRKLMLEIRKCVVLCSNCHRKVHDGLIELDATYLYHD